jgi:hypothetical protein
MNTNNSNTKMQSLEQELSSKYTQIQNGQTVSVKSKIQWNDAKKIRRMLIDENEGALAVKDLFKGDFYVNSPNGTTTCVKNAIEVKYSDLKKFGLVDKLIEALDELIEEKKALRKKNSYEYSKSETMIKECVDTERKHIYLDADLSIDLVNGEYNKADRDFFNWWARDNAGNTYMKKSDGKFIRVPFLEGAVKKIALDADFWTDFYKAHRADIGKFKQHIVNVVYDEYGNETEDYESQDSGMMGRIHEVVPKALCDCFGYRLSILVEKCEYQDEKGVTKTIVVKHLDGVNMTAKVSMNIYKDPTDKYIKLALTDMLTGIDVSEFPLLEEFTNVSTTVAKYYFNAAKLLSSPYSDSIAKMPPNWESFFSSAFLNKPLTQKYRLAKWVRLLLTADSQNRQALLLTGAGYDGKSVFVNALKQILEEKVGKGFMTSCNEEGFRPDNTQNGLVHCLDSRLIYIPELTNPSQFIGGNTFKSITGGDEVTCQIKYKAPIVKSMSGVKFIIVTNRIVYLNESHAFSRIANLYFSPKPEGFKVREASEVEKELAEQGKEFLHWCFAFSTKMDSLLKLPNNLIPITDIDQMVANKSCKLTDMKEAFEGIYGSDDIRCNFKVYDDSQQDKETLFCKFCCEALEKSPYSEITYPELYAVWNQWMLEKNYIAMCRNISIGIGGKDSRAFIKYLKDFFKTSTNSATRGGQSIRIMMNVAKKGDSPTSPTKNSFVSDWT